MTCVLDSCNQGRQPCADPAVCCGRSRRVSEADSLGYEGADAPRVTGAVPPIVTTELREVPSFWQRIGFAAVVALCLLWAAIAVWG